MGHAARAAGGSRIRQVPIGTYPATMGMLRTFLQKIARDLESGKINLGSIRPVENIGWLPFCSIAVSGYYRCGALQSA